MIPTAAAKLLSKLIARLDFTDRAIQNVFRASIPKWYLFRALYDSVRDPPFIGVQPLVMKGLLSPVTDAPTVDLLTQLALMPYDDILHPQPPRFIANIVRNFS